MTNSQQDRPATPEEDIRELYSRVAKLSDRVAALHSPKWGAEAGLLSKDHPLYPKPSGPAATEATEPASSPLREQLRAALTNDQKFGLNTSHAAGRAPILYLSGTVDDMLDTALAVIDPHGDQAAALERGHRCLLENHDKRLHNAETEVESYRAAEAYRQAAADTLVGRMDAIRQQTTEGLVEGFEQLIQRAEQAEADVQRVIDVTEAGPPSGAASDGEWERGWDAAMDAVRKALTPTTEQPRDPS